MHLAIFGRWSGAQAFHTAHERLTESGFCKLFPTAERRVPAEVIADKA